jgi:hypothetical protein
MGVLSKIKRTDKRPDKVSRPSNITCLLRLKEDFD